MESLWPAKGKTMKLEIKAEDDGALRIIAHDEREEPATPEDIECMAALKIPHAHVEIHSVRVSERSSTPDSPVHRSVREEGARGTGERQ